MTKPKPELRPPSAATKLLAQLAETLEQHDVRYLVIGGMAVNRHGYTRYTKDVDFELDVPPWEVQRLLPIARDAGLTEAFAGAAKQAEVSCLLPLQHPSKVVADLALSPGEYFDTAWSRRATQSLHGSDVAFAAVEDLIIRKIIANRPLDRVDIDQLLLRHAPRLDLAYLDTWLERFEEVTDQPLRTTFAELLEQSRH